MQVTLQDRERLNKIGSGLEDIMDALVASVQGGWDVEHDHFGRHVDINARSVYSLNGYSERNYPTSMGHPIPYTPFIKGAFTNNPTSTSCVWFPMGTSIFLSMSVAGMSVAGGATVGKIQLPLTFTGVEAAFGGACYAFDNNVLTTALWEIHAKDSFLAFTLPALANWAASVNGTSILVNCWLSVIPQVS